jgi:hypothetical protein
VKKTLIAVALLLFSFVSIVRGEPQGSATKNLSIVVNSAPVTPNAAAPVIYFTDLQTAVNTGGETVSGFSGSYVTIYGNNFGATQGSSTITWNGLNCLRVLPSVGSYNGWGTSYFWYQKIIVQFGSSCTAGTGNFVITTGLGTSNAVSFTVNSSGNIFCVSTTGNDSNNGKFPSNCWATVYQASQTMNAGDTTYVENGVLDNAIRAFTATIPLSKGGSAGSPISYVIYPGATATIGDVNNSPFAIRTPNIGISANYLIFAGLNIRGQVGLEGSQSNDHNWIIADDFACSGTSGFSCLHFDISTNIFTYGNYLHDLGTNCSANGGNPTGAPCKFHGFYYTTNTNHVWVGWNYLNPNASHENTGNSGGCNGVQFFSTGGSDQFDLHVHDNKIVNVVCGGITFSTVNPDAGTVEAYNNVIAHSGTGPDPSNSPSNYSCINVGNSTHTNPVSIYNNSFYDCGSRGNIDNSNAAFTTGANTSLINNSIELTGSGEQYIIFNSGGCSQISGNHNLWFGNGTIPCATQLAGDTNVDPLYVSLTLDSWDLHTHTGSTLTGYANTTPMPTYDFDGSPRPSQLPSIGAFEGNWVVMNRLGDISNSEVECYKPSQISVSSSLVNLTAISQSTTGCHDKNLDGSTRNSSNTTYTSGMLQTGAFSFTFGDIQFRLKGTGAGTWPGSIWLLGKNCQLSTVFSPDNIGTCAWDSDTNSSAEIDIAEMPSASGCCTQVQHHVHSNDGGTSSFDAAGAASSYNTTFHVYELIWTSSLLTFKVDGTTTATYNGSHIPQNPMFLIMNLAVGGSGGGSPNPANFPQTMQTDWVKVCSSTCANGITGAAATNGIFWDDFNQ